MSPAEFLAMASPGHDEDKQKNVASLVQRGVKFRSTPLLQFMHDGEGTARVIAHEGRHRARALRSLGVTQMPVRFLSSASIDGPAIRWGSQDNRIDRVPVMPMRLRSEDGRKTILFPKSVFYGM